MDVITYLCPTVDTGYVNFCKGGPASHSTGKHLGTVTSIRIESIKTTSMEIVSTGVLEKIKNISCHV